MMGPRHSHTQTHTDMHVHMLDNTSFDLNQSSLYVHMLDDTSFDLSKSSLYDHDNGIPTWWMAHAKMPHYTVLATCTATSLTAFPL